MRHALEDEHSDRGTISMPTTTNAMTNPQARLFSGDFVPQRQLTLDERRAEEEGQREMTKKRHHRGHRHHSSSSASSSDETEALNAKLDRVLGTMQHIMLTNQDTNVRIKKIDRAGELVEKLEKMSADYSDAIGIMRGQFMSLIEVSSTVTVAGDDNEKEKDGNSAIQGNGKHHHHHHHHHHHSGSNKEATTNVSNATDTQPQTSGEQSLLQSSAGSADASSPARTTPASGSSANNGINLLDQDTGVTGTVPPDIAPFEMLKHDNFIRDQNLIQDDDNDEPASGSNEGKLQRRLFPGGQRPSRLAGVAAPNLGDDPKPHSSLPTMPHSSTNSPRTASAASPSHRNRGEDEGSEESDEEDAAQHHQHHGPPRSLESRSSNDNAAAREGGTGGVEAGSVAYADGLLMQAHENRMDRVIAGMESLIKLTEENFERIRELKRELDIFLQVDVVTAEISADQRALVSGSVASSDDRSLAASVLPTTGIANPSSDIGSFADSSVVPPITPVTAASGDAVTTMEAITAATDVATNAAVITTGADITTPAAAASSDATLAPSTAAATEAVPIDTITEKVPQTTAAALNEGTVQIHDIETTSSNTPSIPSQSDRLIDAHIPQGSDDTMIDAGIALDIAGDMEIAIMDIESIRGGGGRPDEQELRRNVVQPDAEGGVNESKLSLWQAVQGNLRKHDLPDVRTAVEHAADAHKGKFLPIANPASEAANLLDRYVRKVKHNFNFVMNYYPPKLAAAAAALL